jgi:lysyl-tRNA synthetase class 2
VLTSAFLHVLSGHFQMDRLVRFNEKFSPEWRPRFLVYDSRLALPRIAVRVLQAEGYLPEPRLLRSRFSHRAAADASRSAVQRWDS